MSTWLVKAQGLYIDLKFDMWLKFGLGMLCCVTYYVVFYALMWLEMCVANVKRNNGMYFILIFFIALTLCSAVCVTQRVFKLKHCEPSVKKSMTIIQLGPLHQLTCRVCVRSLSCCV